MHSVKGIHHVSAIISDLYKNFSFFTGILGLKLVKQTVNFDNPEVYHLYYGDEAGTPGSLITFFPYSNLPQGRHGKKMMNTLGLSLSAGSLDFWLERLENRSVMYKPPVERFRGEIVVYLEDPDGLGLELVFTENLKNPLQAVHPDIPEAFRIGGIFHAELWVDRFELTAGILSEYLGYELTGSTGNRFRFKLQGCPGFIDILETPESLRGLNGSGTFHHIAFAVEGENTLGRIREKLLDAGLNPTEILNRKYFKSVYFREPGGVLFELATIDPGMTLDENPQNLGKSLQLPPWLETGREELMKKLPPFPHIL
jgi:glyoxalase family protein